MMMIRQRRVNDVTDEEPLDAQLVSVAVTDDDASDAVIGVVEEEGTTITGNYENGNSIEASLTGEDEGEDDDEEESGDDGSGGNDEEADDEENEGDEEEVENGDDGSRGNDEEEKGNDDDGSGVNSEEKEPEVVVEENESADEDETLDVNVDEEAVPVNSDDDAEMKDNMEEVNGQFELPSSDSEDDDFALELIEEKLDEFESEYGSSFGDDFLVETAVTAALLDDDQDDNEDLGSNTNEPFVSPKSDMNENDLDVVSLPSSHGGTSYYNQSWNYLIVAVLAVGFYLTFSKYFAPNRTSKYHRRRNMDHKRLPTIEDDDSSA